jgi:hypothetical protein
MGFGVPIDLRGYGVSLWLLVQDLSQLEAVYPKWRTFLANTTLQAFGTQDYQTARYLSDVLGQTTVGYITESFGTIVRPGHRHDPLEERTSSRTIAPPAGRDPKAAAASRSRARARQATFCARPTRRPDETRSSGERSTRIPCMRSERTVSVLCSWGSERCPMSLELVPRSG